MVLEPLRTGCCFLALGLIALVPRILPGTLPGAPGHTAQLLISEFVVRPSAGEGEWVELENPGPDAVFLEGWGIRDATGTVRRIAGNPRVDAGGFAVLAARPDSLKSRYEVPPEVPVIRPEGWPVLNDHDAGRNLPADVIVLVGREEGVADSVAYFESWLPARDGRSLERSSSGRSGLDPGNWGWSLDAAGATPGRRNSLALPEGTADGVWSGPSRVRPGSAPGVFDYRVPAPGILAIQLLDPRGREVVVLQPPRESAAVGRWVWGSGVPVPPRPGLYFVCLRWQGPGSPPVRRCLPVWVAV